MCGIIYAKSRGRHVNKLILKRYEAQKARGSQGFGYVSIQDGKLAEHILQEKEHDIKKFVKNNVTKEMLFHHRLPTSTANLYEAAHPIEVENDSLKYRYFLAHNGVINNSKDLYDKHVKLGFQYTTELRKETRIITRDRQIHDSVEVKFNDSESLAIELARFVEGLSDSIDTRGAVAFVMFQFSKEDASLVRVFFGRNEGNPLNVERNNEFFVLKSSSQNGEEVEANKIFVLDPKTDRVGLYKEVQIGSYYSYKPPKYYKDYYEDGYKSTNAGFTSQLPAPKQKTLEWEDDSSKLTHESSEDLLRRTHHQLPGEGEDVDKYEDKLNELETEKLALQYDLKETNEKIISLKDIRENDEYWNLLYVRETIEEEIEKIEDKINDIYQEFMDTQ